MKKLLLALLVLFLQVFLSGCAIVPEPEPDYRALLTEAAAAGDSARGQAVQRERDARLGESKGG